MERSLPVVKGGASSEQRYLAYLILGGLAEQDGQPGRALEAYGAAHAVHPQAQTAHIAFMRAEQMPAWVSSTRSAA